MSSAIASALQTLCLEDRSQNTADEASVCVCVNVCLCSLKFISLPSEGKDYVFLKLGITARMIFFSLFASFGDARLMGSSRKHPYRFSTLFKETLTCAIAKIVKS